MDIKVPENKYYIALVNRELKRLHVALQSTDKDTASWARGMIHNLHRSMLPIFFLSKDSGISEQDLK